MLTGEKRRHTTQQEGAGTTKGKGQQRQRNGGPRVSSSWARRHGTGANLVGVEAEDEGGGGEEVVRGGGVGHVLGRIARLRVRVWRLRWRWRV